MASPFDTPLAQWLLGTTTPPPTPVNIPSAAPTATAPEVTQPNVMNKPPSPIAVPFSPLQSVINQSSALGNIVQAGGPEALINATVKQNSLNAAYQCTYHFRLFMASDRDMLTQTGDPTTVLDLLRGIDNVSQVTIAESGVTGFNIKDVVITTVSAQNNTTGTQAATQVIMTVTEPNGLSFLDGFLAGASFLQIANYTKAAYYLELKFMGYDEHGAFTGNLATGDGLPGRWIWALSPNLIEAKLNEGGGIYTLNFTTDSTAYLMDEYDVVRVPAPILATGNTIRALFDNYIDQLQIAWNTKCNGELIHFEKIVTRQVGAFFPNPPAAAAKDPATFTMKPDNPEENPSLKWDMTSPTGLYTVNVRPGSTIQDFINGAILHTKEGEALAIDNDYIAGQSEVSPLAPNARKFRASIFWSVEPVIKISTKDTTSRNYIRYITFHVVPHYSNVVYSPADIEAAKSPATQYAIVKDMADNGFVNKRYDYVYTGLNTEVIDFDIAFKMQWSVELAAFSGAIKRYDAIAMNALQNPANRYPDDNANEVPWKVTPSPCYVAPPSGGTPANSPSNGQGRVGSSNAPNAQVTVPKSNIYIEDLLNNQTTTTTTTTTGQEFKVPLSFWQTNGTMKSPTNGMFSGNYTRTTGIMSGLFNQLGNQPNYYDAFQSVKLTIRGDPFWLGQSNLHRNVLLTGGSVSVIGNSLPDFHTGRQAIFLHFRYPYTMGDDFKPNFKNSDIFNGIYDVVNVESSFSDGVFKQELTCWKHPLLDTSLWPANNPVTSTLPFGGAASSLQLAPTASTASATGTAVSSSPIAGVDYTPGNQASFIAAFTPLAQQQSALTGVAPEIILAQAGLESGWGKSAQQNNFFGIKGSGASLPTTEVINGQTQTVNQNFASYASPASSFAQYGNLISTRYPSVANANGIAAQAQALQAAGYATDSQYANKITNIAQSIRLPPTVASIP